MHRAARRRRPRPGAAAGDGGARSARRRRATRRRGRRHAALRPRRRSLRRRDERESGGARDRHRDRGGSPRGGPADPRRLVRRQRPGDGGVPARLGRRDPARSSSARRRSSSSRPRATDRSRSTSSSARRSPRCPGRVALIASADHGHAHDADGPYGFDPAAAEYDALLQEILASDRLDFLPLAALVEAGKADSLWQLLVLQGAVGEEARADVLAYAAPTYYGMLVAEVQTAA